MRTIDSSILVLKPSNFAWWHRSWTGRFVLAALLIAAAAFALMPDRTSAQTTLDPDVVCQAWNDESNADDNGGRIDDDAPDAELISDCKALINAAKSLRIAGTPVGTIATNSLGWIRGEIPPTWNIDDNGDWRGVTVDDVDGVMRVREIDLNGTTVREGLTGTLAAEWAELSALTTLDLSDNAYVDNDGDATDESHNGLTGSPSRSLWTFLGGLTTLDLSGNPDLAPSPVLGLTAVVTKGDEPERTWRSNGTI